MIRSVTLFALLLIVSSLGSEALAASQAPELLDSRIEDGNLVLVVRVQEGQDSVAVSAMAAAGAKNNPTYQGNDPAGDVPDGLFSMSAEVDVPSGPARSDGSTEIVIEHGSLVEVLQVDVD